MKGKAGSIFAVLLVFVAFMVFVSEAPAPTLEIMKTCRNATAEGDPIPFSATISNPSIWDFIVTNCYDTPPATFDPPVSFPVTIPSGNSFTITGYYTPAAYPSTDTITCDGYIMLDGSPVTFTLNSNPATCHYETGEGCTRTPGYWKNHPGAWPVASITIGGHTYTKAEAIEIMEMPVVNDKSLTMFKALVAAKLNEFSEADVSCVITTIADADAWMRDHPAGSLVPASSFAWNIGQPLYLRLDDYNNGRLCTPHCD